MRVLIALDIAVHRRSRRHLRTALKRRDDLRLRCVFGWCFICCKTTCRRLGLKENYRRALNVAGNVLGTKNISTQFLIANFVLSSYRKS